MSNRKTKEQFIEKAIEIHGDKYDYSKVKYKNAKNKITIICKKHGEFNQEAGSHLLGSGCKKCVFLVTAPLSLYTSFAIANSP